MGAHSAWSQRGKDTCLQGNRSDFLGEAVEGHRDFGRAEGWGMGGCVVWGKFLTQQKASRAGAEGTPGEGRRWPGRGAAECAPRGC